jgi:glycosyltransferase involved in cell wall biosynthesis
MNILFITCWYPSKSNQLKGIFVKEHAKAIAENNNILVFSINVTNSKRFFCVTPQMFKDENGINTHILNIESILYKWIYINPFLLFLLSKKYYKQNIEKSFRPDIVHSNVINPAGIIGHWFSLCLNKSHVITEHWSRVDKFMSRNVFSYFAKKAYNSAVAVTTVSAFLKDSLQKYINDVEKIKVIPNIIDSDNFYFKEKYKIVDKITFTAVATWEPPKRPDLFLTALSNIANNANSEIIVNIIGEGSLINDWKLQRDCKLKINFTGKLSKNEIAKVLHESDFFLHASDIETFSIVVAEALATGTPVVASNVAALPELINYQNGLVCNNTVSDWQNAITEIIKKHYNHKLVSINIFGKYSHSIIGNQFNDIYHRIN